MSFIGFCPWSLGLLAPSHGCLTLHIKHSKVFFSLYLSAPPLHKKFILQIEGLVQKNHPSIEGPIQKIHPSIEGPFQKCFNWRTCSKNSSFYWRTPSKNSSLNWRTPSVITCRLLTIWNRKSFMLCLGASPMGVPEFSGLHRQPATIKLGKALPNDLEQAFSYTYQP